MVDLLGTSRILNNKVLAVLRGLSILFISYVRYRDRCPGSPPLKCGSYLGTSGIKYITRYIRVYRISLLQEAPRAYQNKCEDVSEVFDSVHRERECEGKYMCLPCKPF